MSQTKTRRPRHFRQNLRRLVSILHEEEEEEVEMGEEDETSAVVPAARKVSKVFLIASHFAS